MVEVVVLVVDQATFDTALGEFLAEVTEVLGLLPLKAPGVDFAAEMQQIGAAKAKLDAALAASGATAPAADGAPVGAPAPADETIPALGPDGQPVPVPEPTVPAVEAPAPDAAPAEPVADPAAPVVPQIGGSSAPPLGF